MTLLVGSEGSMGRRYQAILKFVKEDFDCLDVNKPKVKDFKYYNRFIIASPTSTHFSWINELSETGKPILCEKPLSKNLDEVRQMLFGLSPVSMMMQYKYLVEPSSMGPSWYSYFRHGNDGLVWDLFQIIALAQGSVAIAEDSPIWDCGINGKKLNFSDMDAAYVKAVVSFLSGQYIEPHLIMKWHQKVKDFEEEWTRQRYQS